MSIIVPAFNEACIVISAILMAIGWVYIRRGNIQTHRRLMLTSVAFAALFFITYVLKTVLIGDTLFGGPQSWRGFYYAFLQTHSFLATVAAILGIITLVYAFREKFTTHRKFGPWTAVTWFITAITGVSVFLMLYVIFPPGETTNLFRAWLGH